jgi:hypothetical protein
MRPMQPPSINGGFSVQLSNAGGVGGGVQGGGSTASQGTGNSGAFSVTSNYGQGGTGEPSFFLNTNYISNNAGNLPPIQGSEGLTTAGAVIPLPCVTANTCNAYNAIPPWTAAGISVNPLYSTGNYNPQEFCLIPRRTDCRPACPQP